MLFHQSRRLGSILQMVTLYLLPTSLNLIKTWTEHLNVFMWRNFMSLAFIVIRKGHPRTILLNIQINILKCYPNTFLHTYLEYDVIWNFTMASTFTSFIIMLSNSIKQFIREITSDQLCYTLVWSYVTSGGRRRA